MNRNTSFAVLAIFLFSPVAPAQALNGLCVYLDEPVIARNFAPRHLYFLADGRYLNDAPKEVLSAAGTDPVCA